MVWLEAFLDGVTGAGLFGRLSWPGSPTEFIDSRTLAEFTNSRESQLPLPRGLKPSLASLKAVMALKQASASRPH